MATTPLKRLANRTPQLRAEMLLGPALKDDALGAR